MHDDDDLLVRRHLAGDRRAFGALVERYQHRLLRSLQRAVGNRGRAEDLSQEVFIQAFRQLPQFHQRTPFATWINLAASRLAESDQRSGTQASRLAQRPLEAVRQRLSRALRSFVLAHQAGVVLRSDERRSAVGGSTG